MAQPWFDPNQFGAIYGTTAGCIGGMFGLWGALTGCMAPRGKWKRTILTGFTVFGGLAVLSLLWGVIALAAGQPFFLWFHPILIGGMCLFMSLFFSRMVRQMYAQAEARRMEAASFRDS